MRRMKWKGIRRSREKRALYIHKEGFRNGHFSSLSYDRGFLSNQEGSDYSGGKLIEHDVPKHSPMWIGNLPNAPGTGRKSVALPGSYSSECRGRHSFRRGIVVRESPVTTGNGEAPRLQLWVLRHCRWQEA